MAPHVSAINSSDSFTSNPELEAFNAAKVLPKASFTDVSDHDLEEKFKDKRFEC
jgi:hypothetical protein